MKKVALILSCVALGVAAGNFVVALLAALKRD